MGVDQLKSYERWMIATASAMRSLTRNFPASECARRVTEAGWETLSSKHFPCQKSDNSALCPGWNWSSPIEGLGPFKTVPCPCAQGRSLVLSPLLELAHEFSNEVDLPVTSEMASLRAFQRCTSESEFRLQILNWMHFSALSGFQAIDSVDWVEGYVAMPLEASQRQALRWWARLTELNQLIHNNVFTLLTRRGLEELYAKGQMLLVSQALNQIHLKEGALVVLFMTGSELAAVGAHSNRLGWLEAFISCIDERQLGLCLVARQPLLEPNDQIDGFSKRPSADFRWKAKHGIAEFAPPLESLLRRGVWDRLAEAIARGDHILRARLAAPRGTL